MKISLLINMKMPTIVAFSYLLAEKISYFTENFSANEYENANYCFIFISISRENFIAELSMKNVL